MMSWEDSENMLNIEKERSAICQNTPQSSVL